MDNSFYALISSLQDSDRRVMWEKVRAFWLKLPDVDRREIFDLAFDKLDDHDREKILAQAARIYPKVPSMGERLAMELVACLGIYTVLREYGQDTLRKTDHAAH